MKRTPLRRVSIKLAAGLKEYARLKKQWFAKNPLCKAKQACQSARTKDVHHMAGRGKNLNNVDTWLPVCRACHDWIHANARKARDLNLLQ